MLDDISAKTIGIGLRLWREKMLNVHTRREMLQRLEKRIEYLIQSRRSEHSWYASPEQASGEKKNKFRPLSVPTETTLRRWEEGDLSTKSYVLFDLVLPAYEVTDPIILVAIAQHELANGDQNQLADEEILRAHHYATLERERKRDGNIIRDFLPSRKINGPMRIEHFQVNVGGSTRYSSHVGWEFALVLEGEFELRYGWPEESNPDEFDSTCCNEEHRTIPLTKFQSVEFNSSVPHTFVCTKGATNSKPGIFVVAKSRDMDYKISP